ncbi:MAG: CotH kinase family protein [Saprospiraceae bacterium]
MILLRNPLIIFSLICLPILLKAGDTIRINPNQYFIDFDKKLVLTNVDVGIVNSTWTNTKTHILLNEVCVFLTPNSNIEIGTAYSVIIPSQNTSFALYFTQLPIISIATNYTIVDEPDVLANFKMIESDQNYLESYVGIQIRGGWTQTLPKKSMEIEFWTDTTGNETQDFSLLGMVNDDDWNLQAMFNEPLRIRSKTNNDLWRMINELHYRDEEPEAINGIRMKFVELFINNEYRGLYCLGEKVNRKQLKLKKHNGNIRGELYKGISWGASTFAAAPPYDNNSLEWSGFEYKHPEEEINWENLYELVDFVINASDQDFYEGYKDEFELDNLVDYYIFLNLLRATDNTGKNIYIAKYTSDSPYFYVPWDLDGTFGTIWDGSNENITNDLLSNGFYNRLNHDCAPDGFRERLKNKWLDLRSKVVTHDSLISLFTINHDYLKTNGVYDREHSAWSEYVYQNTDLDYMSSWITNRLSYLDVKFTEECKPSSIENAINKPKHFTIYPNPTSEVIHLKSTEIVDFSVSICNNLGQTVLQQSFNYFHNGISLKDLNKGVYYLKIEHSKGIEIHRIILGE